MISKLNLKKFDAVALAHQGVRKLEPYQAGKAIEALERELGIHDIIKLASNENPLGPSLLALDAVSRHLKDLHFYPDASGISLKSKLADMHHVMPEMITLGNGSENIFDLVIRAFCQPGDEIMISEYAFIAYQIIAKGLGVDVNQIPAKQYGHDLNAMLTAISDRTKVIFIVNPNNPTGTYLSIEALKTFLRMLSSDILVVLDEAYCEYMDGALDYQSGVHWIDEFPNLIITRTFSKAYGLAGVRIGYAVSHPDVRDLLNRIRQPFNVNSLALVAALAALDDVEHVAKTTLLNRESLELLIRTFSKMGLSYVPPHANFVLVDLKQDAMPVYGALLKRGVIVRPVVPYNLRTHLRISTGTLAETNRFIKEFKNIMQCQEVVNE
ncbi:MAG: histidinol-phosphate transaminase [Gammaproteobacteria bacterium]